MRRLTAAGKRMLTSLGKWATACLSWPPADPCPITTPPCVETTYPCSGCPTGKTPHVYRLAFSAVRFDCVPANHNMDVGCQNSRCGGTIVGDIFYIDDVEFAGVFDLTAVSACVYEYREVAQSTVSVAWRNCDGTDGPAGGASDAFDLVIHWDMNTVTVDLIPTAGGDLACAGTFSVNIAVMTLPLGECTVSGTTTVNCGFVDNDDAIGGNPALCFAANPGVGYHHGQGGTVSGQACS